MLQVNHRQVVDNPTHVAVEEASSLSDLVDFFSAILYREYLLILSMIVLAIGLGALYIYITPPTFAARATVLIDRGKMQSQLGSMLREVPVDAVEVESHIQLVKSETVARAVIKKLNLAADPEFVGPPVGLAGWIYQLTSKLRSSEPPPDPTPPDPLVAVTSRLLVNRVSGSVIEIEFRSLVPERAAEIANTFADCYVEDQLHTRSQAARQAASWLQDRIRELGDQSSLADETVVQFKTRNNMVAAGGRLINDQQLAELNTQLGIAREKTSESRARLDRIEIIIRTGQSDSNKLGGTVSDTLNNPVIVKLRSQYLELSSREAELSRRLGKDHLAVANLERQIKGVRDSITDELSRIAETYKSEYEIAKQRQAEIERTVAEAVATIPRRQPGLDRAAAARELRQFLPDHAQVRFSAQYRAGPAAVVSRHRGPADHAGGDAHVTEQPQDPHYPAGDGFEWNDLRPGVWHPESHAGEGIPHVRAGRGGAPGKLHRLGAFAQTRQGEHQAAQSRIADDA